MLGAIDAVGGYMAVTLKYDCVILNLEGRGIPDWNDYTCKSKEEAVAKLILAQPFVCCKSGVPMIIVNSINKQFKYPLV